MAWQAADMLITRCCWLPVLQISVVTKFPNLVDLQGPAQINQTDIAEIMGYTGVLMSQLHQQHSELWCPASRVVA